MKIQRATAVAFLVALGFSKAGQWDDEKIKAKLEAAPTKVDAGDVPDGHEEFYRALVKAEGVVELEGGPAKGKAKSEAAPKEPAKDEAPKKMSKKERKAEARRNRGKAKSEPETEPLKADGPAKTKKNPTRKTGPGKKDDGVERDAYGCRKGSISYDVNKVITNDWQTEEEIAEAAKVPLDQARGRLYYAASKGLFERERAIRYRLKKPAKA